MYFEEDFKKQINVYEAVEVSISERDSFQKQANFVT